MNDTTPGPGDNGEEELATASSPPIDERLDPVAMARARAAVRSGLFSSSRSRAADVVPRVGRYALVRRIGEGGFGTVFEGHDPELDRAVAIKLVPLDSWSRSADVTAEEARTMARLRHPSLVTVHDVGTCDGSVILGPEAERCLFIVMELLSGQSLRAWWSSPRPTSELLTVFAQVADAMVAAHQAGVVHRDLKPSNIFVEDGRPIVLDFGLARLVELERTGVAGDDPLVSQISGTPSYMAPEQHEGRRVGPAADQFSLGVCLFEALFGVLPFRGPGLDALASTKRAGPPSIPSRRGLSSRHRRALRRALHPDPTARFDDAQELADALRPRRRGRTVLARAMAAGALVLGGWSAWVSGEDECDRFAGVAAELWSPSARQRVHRAFSGHGLSYGEAAFERADQRLHERTATWADARIQACRDQAKAETTAMPSARAYCLDRYYSRASALIELLGRADATVVGSIDRTLDMLDGLDRCDSSYELPPIPAWLIDEPSVGLEIDAQLARAWAMMQLGQHGPARELAGRAAERAREVGASGLLAEAEAVTCHAVDDHVGRGPSAELCERAALAAEGAQRPRLAVETRLHVVRLTASVFPGQAAEQLGLARARRADVGPDPILDARIQWAQAKLDGYQGRFDVAIRSLRELVPVFEMHAGAGASDVISLRGDLASLHSEAGQVAEARAQLEALLEIVVRTRGANHPTVGSIYNNIGRVLVSAGQMQDAEQALLGAIAAKERSDGRDSPRLISSLTNLATLRRDTGDVEGALEPLRRAIGLAQRLSGEGYRLDRLRALEIDLSRTRGDRDACEQLEVILARMHRETGMQYPSVVADVTSQCWKEAGAVEQACRLYDEMAQPAVISGFPVTDRARVERSRAWCAARQGRVPDAIRILQELWQEPTTPAVQRRRALATHAVLVGRDSEAGVRLRELIARPDPGDLEDGGPVDPEAYLSAAEQGLATP